MRAIFNISGIWVFLFQLLVEGLCIRKLASIISRRVPGDPMDGVVFFFVGIPILSFYTWVFVAGVAASHRLTTPEVARILNLKNAFSFLAGYMLLFPFLRNLSLENGGIFGVPMIILHFIASMGGLYIIARTSKLVYQLELHRPPLFREHGKLMGLVLLAWVFSPLMWHVHNRFRRAIYGGSIPEHVNSGAIS